MEMEYPVYPLGLTSIKLPVETSRSARSNKLHKLATGRWKHEEPLGLESESKTHLQAESSPPLFFPFP
jgi:hypothetical protein